MPRIRALSRLLLRTLEGFVDVTGPDEFTRLCRSVATLSHLFTRDRGSLETGYMADETLRRGYIAYFLPVNLGKVQALLDELPAPDPPSSSPLRVLDIGSGPGTAALAVLDWVRHQPLGLQRPIEIVAVDEALPALQEAERLWRTYARSSGRCSAVLTPLHANLQRSGSFDLYKQEGPFDLIVLANSLSELWRDDRDPISSRVTFVRGLIDLLVPHGSLIVVEPALRGTSRSLHEVRDRLLAAGACMVYSPCLHDGPCPALQKAEDWCHEERPWTPPPLVAEIDREVGFIKDALKFSYLLLRKDGRTIVQREPTLYRVVSELREMKGEKRAWLCNETGRPEVGRLDRERSETNEKFDDWHRGAIVRVDQIVRKERKGREATVGRIPAEANVEIIKSV